MSLKRKVKDLNDVPEGYRTAYAKVGDEYVLQLDDDGLAAKLSEFRDNNITLMQEKASLEKLLSSFDGFKGMDAEQAREALDLIQKQKDNKMISEGKIEELLEQRTETMRGDFAGKTEALQAQLEKAAGQSEKYEGLYKSIVIDSQIQNAVSGFAVVRSGAMNDILSRAKSVWTIDENGTPVAKNGDKVLYGKDGKNPMSMAEYAQNLYADANFLFEPNSGGNASGNRDTAPPGSVISRSDNAAINSNLSDIASGAITVE